LIVAMMLETVMRKQSREGEAAIGVAMSRKMASVMLMPAMMEKERRLKLKRKKMLRSMLRPLEPSFSQT
jgi:hypothetical protein